MSTFDKSSVDVAELGGLEIARVVQALGLGLPECSEKLTNGGCAANYHITLQSGEDVVLKACTGDDAMTVAKQQLDVLRHLAMHSRGVRGARAKSMRGRVDAAARGVDRPC